jgi:hypothetical protein
MSVTGALVGASPLAGTTHNITLGELRPSTTVAREKRRQVLHAATQPGGQAADGDGLDDVFDADAL